MKIGRKGFMLAEVVVVSVVVAIVLVTLYIGLNNVVSAYDTRNRYYDIDCLNAAMEMNDILLREVNSLNGMILEEASTLYDWATNLNDIDENFIQNFEEFYLDEIGDEIIAYITPYSSEKLSRLQSYDGRTEASFADYLDYLSGNLDFNESYDYMIIIERRANNNIDDCYYYALKLKY